MPSRNDGPNDEPDRFGIVGRLREASAERDERTGQPIGKFGKQQRDAEQSQEHDRGEPAILVGLHGPAAADRRQRGDDGEGDRHAEQQRQAAFDERLVGAGEDEGQHRQDAGAENGQHAAEIGNHKQEHRLRLLSASIHAASGVNFNASPFMQ